MYNLAMSKVKVISTTEARKRFAAIADELRDGKTSYSVTRHGREVFRMVPTTSEETVRIRSTLTRELASVFTRYDEALKELAKR